MTLILSLFGLAFLGFGGWAALDPASFPAAEYLPYNEHLIHDVAATFLAFGVGLLIAARVTAWRAPVFGLAAIWNAFHAISHYADVDHAPTVKSGLLTAIELTVIALVLAFLSWRSSSRG